VARIDIVLRSCVPDEQAVKSGCRSEAATHVVEFKAWIPTTLRSSRNGPCAYVEYICHVRSYTKCLRRHPISECSASTPDRRRRPGSAPRSSCSGPPPAWARSSAGPLLLVLRVVRAAPIHRSTVALLRVTRTRVRHNMAGGAPARSTPQ